MAHKGQPSPTHLSPKGFDRPGSKPFFKMDYEIIGPPHPICKVGLGWLMGQAHFDISNSKCILVSRKDSTSNPLISFKKETTKNTQ